MSVVEQTYGGITWAMWNFRLLTHGDAVVCIIEVLSGTHYGHGLP